MGETQETERREDRGNVGSPKVGSPHIYHLLSFDHQKHSGRAYSPSVLAACQWLRSHSMAVLSQLLKNSPPLASWAGAAPLAVSTANSAPNWESISFF
jgi:hypothetical protein